MELVLIKMKLIKFFKHLPGLIQGKNMKVPAWDCLFVKKLSNDMEDHSADADINKGAIFTIFLTVKQG